MATELHWYIICLSVLPSDEYGCTYLYTDPFVTQAANPQDAKAKHRKYVEWRNPDHDDTWYDDWCIEHVYDCGTTKPIDMESVS